MASGDYKQIHGDFYGVMKRSDGELESVPFLQFQRKTDKQKCRIPTEKYSFYIAEGLSQREILEKYGQWYKKLVAQALKKERSEKGIYIHDLKEYIEFLLTILPKEKVDEIKEKQKDCQDLTEVIALFPEVYQPLMRLRHEYDIDGDKRFDAKILPKAVARELPEMPKKYYNPNAFIESGE